MWPPFFSVIVSTPPRKALHAFKINSSNILFDSSSIAVLSESIFGGKVTFFVFENAPYTY